MTDNSKTGSPAESLPTTDENRTAPQPQVTRRGLLRAFGVVTGAMAMSGAHAFALEPEWLDDPEFKAGIPSLDANLEGLKIAQVSDLHLRSIGNLHDSILVSIKRKNPDLILLTGDILDSKAHLMQTVEFLRSLAA
ncbi:MAG: hypothetical protein OEV92_11525, partial [Nitrospinota bacterium]|nr:hypothetical protein [Nitrospinota bacterium]